jgi:hypothetical protein
MGTVIRIRANARDGEVDTIALDDVMEPKMLQLRHFAPGEQT